MLTSDPRLSQALDALVARGVLDQAQASEVSAAVSPLLRADVPAPDSVRGRLAEVAGYVGGAFVIGASFLFLAQQWDGLGKLGRVGVLLVTAIVTAAMGVFVARSASGSMAVLRTRAGDPVRRRLTSALFTGASAAAAFAAGLLVSNPGVGGAGPALFGGLVGLGLVITSYVKAPSVVAQSGIVIAVGTVIFAGVDAMGGRSGTPGWALAVGLSFVLAGSTWASMLGIGWWRELRFAQGVAASLGLWGAQFMYIYGDGEGHLGLRITAYVVTVLVAVASFAGFTQTRAWPLLAVGVVATTVVVPEVLLDATDGSVGSSGVLLVAGLTLLAASALSLRLHKESSDSGPSQ